MVRDLKLPELMRAEAKALIEAGTGLLKEADRLDKINRGTHDGAVKRSVNWRTADSIEEILQAGQISMQEDKLLTKLVDDNLVEGNTEDDKLASARKALSMGTAKGYLKRDDGKIFWVPGVRHNARVRKKL